MTYSLKILSGGLGLHFVSPPSLFAKVMVGVHYLFWDAAYLLHFLAGHFLVVFGWFCITLVCLLCRGNDLVQNDALDASVAAHTAEKVFRFFTISTPKGAHLR